VVPESAAGEGKEQSRVTKVELVETGQVVANDLFAPQIKEIPNQEQMALL
jgi:hypothetical protein